VPGDYSLVASGIYRQCQAFSADRERNLLEGMPLPKLYLATDRQTLAVNWSQRKDRRNIMLQAIATADLKTGYVFGMDLNFDPSLNLEEVEAEAVALGDPPKTQAYRRFARLWLQGDYANAVAESAERKAAKKSSRATYKPDQLCTFHRQMPGLSPAGQRLKSLGRQSLPGPNAYR